ETVRAKGISVTGPHDPFEARPAIFHLHEAQRMPRDFDVAFVAMKVYDTAWAAQLVVRHLKPEGFVVAAENCWPDPIVASVAGKERSVGLVMSKIGVASWKAGQVERGHERGGATSHGAPVEQGAEAGGRASWPARAETPTPKAAGGPNWKASMAQDVAKGRPTEIDSMNGLVVDKGREKGIPTPVSAAVVETVREIDRRERKQSPENIGLTLKRAGV